jgi:predicted transcriptional regulator
MKNSERFLSTFNKLDNFLGRFDGQGHHVSFSSNVHRLKKKNRAIRHYEKKLVEYNELRNAIVHDRIDGRVIAEPNDFAVNEFETIFKKISSPKKVIELCQGPVESLKMTDGISKALSLMKAYDYSQIPIYDERTFMGMLNAETITNWLSNSIKDDLISLSDTRIEQVLEHRKDYKKTIFKSRNVNVYELMELYKKNVYEPKQIDAIVITHNGKPYEKPLAIITDYDIPLILREY